MSMDFNNSENQSSFDLIPNNTLAKVRMSIKPGDYDDQNQGWVGGYATKNDATGSIYLSCEFVILEGGYARRKSFIKAILNSARGFSENDNSPQAQNSRRISGLADLDGIEFVAKITTKKDQNEELRNEIRFAITPDNKDYKSLMGIIAPAVKTKTPPAAASAANKGFIEDVRNEKCSDLEIEKLLDVFEEAVKSMAETPAKKSCYDLEKFEGTDRAGVSAFTLTLEREKVKNVEQYTSYFESGHKNLKVVAIRGDMTFVKLKSDS